MLGVPDWGFQSGSWFAYDHWSFMFPSSKFWQSIFISKVQRTSMTFKSWFGLWRMLGVPDWSLVSWLWFGYDYWSMNHLCSNFGFLSWFWTYKDHPCPESPDLGLWRILEVPDWGLGSWSWFVYGHWSLIHIFSEFRLSILILKMQITSKSFKSWFGA